MKHTRSVRLYVISLLAAIIIPFITLFGYLIWVQDEDLQQKTRDETVVVARFEARNTQQFLQESESMLRELAQRPLVRAIDPQNCDPILRDFTTLHADYTNVLVFDYTGALACAGIPPAPGTVIANGDRAWYQQTVRTGTFTVGAPVRGSISGKWITMLAYPIRRDDGATVGVVALPVDLAYFATALLGMYLPADSVIAIVDDQGRFIAHSRDPDLIGVARPDIASAALAITHPSRNARGTESDGVPRIYGFASVPQSPWHISVGIPHRFAFTVVQHPTIRTLAVGTALLVIWTLLLIQVTQKRRHKERLLRNALFDALTGLPNRTLFLDRLTHTLARAHRQNASSFAVLFLDCDRFKTVNDSLGHAVGDAMLCEVASRLAMTVRRIDTVARFGGDEFAVLLKDVEGPHDAMRVAHRIHKAFAAPVVLGDHTFALSASIGIVIGAPSYREPADVLRDADTALYRAKALGHGHVVLFDISMHDEAVVRLELEQDLRTAITMGALSIAYQPVVALDSGALTGFEALVRWEHPVYGPISPMRFIPLAEETGLIVALDRWVMRTACRRLVAWSATLPAARPLTLSVNLSGKHFGATDLVSCVTDILTETGLPPSRLRLEITEGTLIEHQEIARNQLGQLRALGIQVHLDDFGVGYSSLSYLCRYPLDSVKIDRGFIAELDAHGADIVRAIVMLGRSLGMGVIAEGIETETQYATLKQLGCDSGQGFLFASPLDVPTASDHLAQLGLQDAKLIALSG